MTDPIDTDPGQDLDVLDARDLALIEACVKPMRHHDEEHADLYERVCQHRNVAEEIEHREAGTWEEEETDEKPTVSLDELPAKPNYSAGILHSLDARLNEARLYARHHDDDPFLVHTLHYALANLRFEHGGIVEADEAA